jgi:SAM-dependent methyltransferase
MRRSSPQFRRPDSRVTWRTSDAMALPFEAASFDTVVCQFGLMFVPDIAPAICTCWRVLRPGGHLVFGVWGSLDEDPIGRVAHETLREHFPDDPPQFYGIPHGLHDPQPTAHPRQSGPPRGQRTRDGASRCARASVAAKLEAEGGRAPMRLPMRERVFTAIKS